MDDAERRALSSLRFDWAPTPDSVWADPPAHVAELNADVLDAVLAAYTDADDDPTTNPLGVVIAGQQGAGKTHMLGAVRAEVQRRGGYFFLVSLLHGKDFWQNIVHAVRNGLYQLGADGTPQLSGMLRRLADRLALPDHVRRQIVGDTAITKDALDKAVTALPRADPVRGRTCRHTARALALLAAEHTDVQEVGEAYLTSSSEVVPGERAQWGLPPDPKPAHEIVRELATVLAMTGPSVLAIDQIDTLVAQSGRSTRTTPVEMPRDDLYEQIGTGLMELRESLRRSLLVVACQFPVWEAIRSNAHLAAADRFRPAYRLRGLGSAATGRALVAARFGPRFAGIGFSPDYPTWPIRPEAFEDAAPYTPRLLFKRIDEHIRSCLATGVVTELACLEDRPPPPPDDDPTPPIGATDLSALDKRFGELLRGADLGSALDKSSEDARMPALLGAGLRSYAHERGVLCEVESKPARNPALHAQMTQVLDDETGDEVRWSFRAIGDWAPRAVQNRVKRVHVTAGIDAAVDRRRAYVLRTADWTMSTEKTRVVLDEFRAAGGVLIEKVDRRDLATFAALERMLDRPSDELHAWLRLRAPASNTALFREVFGSPDDDVPPAPPDPSPQPGAMSHWPADDPDSAQIAPDTLVVGTRIDTGEALGLPLLSLRKHAVIFAGSGSGKTVLIRRIVEECALRGVSAIVLDPNNDLARLGEGWPTPPSTWAPEDAARAAEYFAHTDVVVWTPRRESGRPISFQPLPDLAAVAGDPDEFGLALDIAVAALAPRARTDGATARADRARAVLREALTSFALKGGAGLRDFLDYLDDLPDEVTELANARTMASELAQTLKAAVINDPLFGGAGTPLDPGVLLTPAPGKRARVSVISMIGLPTDDQRSSFVNQLQMALFAWIKANPAGDRPLGGLFVMDEAQTLAPSGQLTACTTSTLALASQARKYGLGLVFATQAPKGIHNRIVGNAATQFFGFINSPAQVAAAKEMAAAKSSNVADISRLGAGQFYAVSEGTPFVKVRTPMCLSHHPSSALTPEEVLARSRS